jgi:hypothetical protein
MEEHMPTFENAKQVRAKLRDLFSTYKEPKPLVPPPLKQRRSP